MKMKVACQSIRVDIEEEKSDRLTNEQIDTAVLHAIGGGRRVEPKLAMIVAELLGRFGEDFSPTPERAVDRSLQRLRKKGTIAFENGRWKVVRPW